MDIKIHCPCGQKIVFDVEPENGAMPCALACPACQSDITPLANTRIQEQLGVAPAPPAASPQRMRISMSTAHHAAPAPVIAAETSAPAPAVAVGSDPRPVAPAEGADGGATVGRFLMGLAGVFGGALAGLVAWFLLASFGLNMRILALLVAVGAGLGGRILSRGGDHALGGVAAVVAVVGMFFGGILTFDEKLRLKDEDFREAYNQAVIEAKELVTAIPKGTDEEIAAYLKVSLGDEVDAVAVKKFRDSDEFKYARELAEGKRSFQAHMQFMKKTEDELHRNAGGVIAAAGGLRMLSIWLIGLVGGTAYKLAAG